MKVQGQWLNNCLVEIGELSLRANWSLLNPIAVHSSSSVLAKDIIRNRNRTGAILSPCLTTTLKSIVVSFLIMMSLTTLLSYMHLMAEHGLGGAPYFPNMVMSNAWLEVSKAFTRFTNATSVGSFWLCLKCSYFVQCTYVNTSRKIFSVEGMHRFYYTSFLFHIIVYIVFQFK